MYKIKCALTNEVEKITFIGDLMPIAKHMLKSGDIEIRHSDWERGTVLKVSAGAVVAKTPKKGGVDVPLAEDAKLLFDRFKSR